MMKGDNEAMYLTRVLLDARSKETAKGILRPNHFHANLEDCFPGERKRRLWRIDSYGGELYLLVVSQDKTSLDSFTKRFSPNEGSSVYQSKDYKPFLQSLRNDMVCRFRLVANPVHSVAEEGDYGKRGKVKAHVTPQHQKAWLLKRQERMGVIIDEESLEITSDRKLRFKNRNQMISLLQVGFEGLLTVKDEQKLKEALINGVGRGKAFGCGLLTVMTVRDNEL
ncbi:MAG: type I-E CRISPR-associated protein Cas6/Cse3/CasE [Eubacteriales bacterium]|nr:type I-E CRISPR-associated protein Cas6/Cse3/CasE [Eubacteriales bacterium]